MRSSARRNASYTYDYLGNRIRMTVGADTRAATTRFVYQGKDVVAEYVDTTGDCNADHSRVYWILPERDQRIKSDFGAERVVLFGSAARGDEGAWGQGAWGQV